MKKLFVVLLLFAGVVSAQQWETVLNDTCGNSQSKTIYVSLLKNTIFKVDSIAIAAGYTGEIDVDQLIVTKGIWTGSAFIAVATPDTTTLTINNAASTTTGGVYSSSSTGLNSLEGYSGVKIVFVSASSGNDSTDPNKLRVQIAKYQSQ